jgi:23S rRNA (cytosine1962-C5)-methyltransferase
MFTHASFDNVPGLTLSRDLSKHIKRGHPWVFRDALAPVVKGQHRDGCLSKLFDKKGELLAYGFYGEQSALSFRVLSIGRQKLTAALFEQLIIKRLDRALELRLSLFTETNKTFRLLSGEGDELPGLVADYYEGLVIIKLDGAGADLFWKPEDFADYFSKQKFFPVQCVYHKLRARAEESERGTILFGNCPLEAHPFREHGRLFMANFPHAAKTGFFIDQRENRDMISKFSRHKTVLNLFSYTGGFSIAAGCGGATHVTSVDISKQAILEASRIWELNGLPASQHRGVHADCFAFIKEAQAKKEQWDIVIADPPSFAPNQKALESAVKAYVGLFAESIKLTKHQGLFAASSCSAHISFEEFLQHCEKALSEARVRGKILSIQGQPIDHPFPMALPEMRYLKFVLFQILRD